MSNEDMQKRPLQLLSVVILAQNEGDCIASTVEHLYVELRLHNVPHEIIVVDDGSTDETWTVLDSVKGPPRNRFITNYGTRSGKARTRS